MPKFYVRFCMFACVNLLYAHYFWFSWSRKGFKGSENYVSIPTPNDFFSLSAIPNLHEKPVYCFSVKSYLLIFSRVLLEFVSSCKKKWLITFTRNTTRKAWLGMTRISAAQPLGSSKREEKTQSRNAIFQKLISSVESLFSHLKHESKLPHFP